MIDTHTRAGRAAFASAIAVAGVGLCVLGGWVFQLEFLKRLDPDLVAMNPATAVALILAGVSLALFLQSPRGGENGSRPLILTARFCALGVTLIGLARLADIGLGSNFGVDQQLFSSALADRLRPPNRIAPNTAMSLLLLGSALLLVDVKKHWVRLGVQFCAVVVGLGSILVILAYAYHTPSFYGLSDFIPMALHTSIALCVLAAALLLSQSDHGLLAVFAGDSAGGSMARRLLPAAVFVPAVLGWLALQGEEAGLYGGGFSVAAFAVGIILVFTLLICWSARELSNAELVRKNAEVALQESEASTRLLVKSSNIGLWDWNLLTNEVFFSQEWKNQLGYADTELESRFEEWESRLHPADRDSTLAAVKEYVEGHRANYEMEFRLRHKDGSWRWFLTRGGLANDRVGQPERIRGCHIDITERKQWEEALRTSESRYHLLFENMMEGYAYCRTTFENDQLRDFTYLEVNSAFERLTGLKDVVGKRISEVVPGVYEATPELFEVFSRVLLTGKAEKYETCLKPLGIWFSITVYSHDREYFVAVFENITERKEAAQALHELSQRTKRRERILTTMLSSISDFAYIFDRQGRFLFVNQPLLDLWGLKLEEVTGKDFIDLKYPDDLAAKLAQQVQEVFATRQNLVDEIHYTNPAGLPGIYEHIFSPAFADDGSVDFVVGCTRDITGRKEAETALRSSETEFRVLAEAMPQILWVTRPDGWHTHFNQRWIDYTGLTLEESRGQGWRTPFHPEDQPLAAQRWKHANDTGEPYEIEYRLRGADGSYRWMLGRAMPLRDAAGEIVKWFGTCTDIHDLKAAELEISRANRELRESDERFHQLADNISDVFWITSPDFHTKHYVSPGYERIWGRSTGSLYANPRQWAEAILPEDRDPTIAALAPIMGNASEATVEYRIVRPDGSLRWIHDRGFQVRDAAGELVRLAGIASDITERKRAEAELAKTHAELVKASRQAGMSEVATSVLHNVGNVLNSVNVSCAVVADRVRKSRVGSVTKTAALLHGQADNLAHFLTVDPTGKRLPDFLGKLAEQLTTAQDEVLGELKLLAANIDHIKDIVAMQQNYAKVSGITETVHLADLIDDSLRMNEESLAHHSVHVVREICDLPPIAIEKHKALQILVNLIRNAKHACEDSGSPHKQITVRVTAGETRFRIAVIDNGIGIPVENLTRIFAHGFTTKPKGHGFGLHSGAIAAREMGGSLTASSDGPGTGATFILELPASPPGATTIQP